MKNNIDWKKIGNIAIKIGFILILNVALWVYLIGSMVPYMDNGEFKLSWIDYLRLSKFVPWYATWLLYIGIGIGIMLSFAFLKWWYEASKREKDKQEIIQAQKENTERILKQQAKEDKDVRKYL